MNIIIPLRSARAGCLRAVRGVLRTPEDLDALVQRQYGWHNATHGNRRRHHHAAQ